MKPLNYSIPQRALHWGMALLIFFNLLFTDGMEIWNRALRKGDRFSVVYETLEADGEAMRTGRVLSTEFVNGGKKLQAIKVGKEPEGVKVSADGLNSDLHGSAAYRAAMISVMASRAVAAALAR